MALADTARLIASLELQDKFTGPAKRAEGSIGTLDKKMGTLGESGKKLGAGLGRAFSTIAKIGVGVAAGGIALLSVQIKAGVDSLNELESVTAATETVLKSTDGVAGQSAKGVRALAEEYEALNATIDDKVIQNAENLLLTFTNVRGKAFEPALAAALNLNQAMGGGEEGLQGTIISLGKALNDPIKGVSKLTRVGVTFTDQQKKQIATLQENGDLLGAQQIILDELATEFGGQFARAGDTAEGSMARLGDAVEDLQQRLAGPLIPVIDRVRDKLTTFLESRTARRAAEGLGDAIAGIFTDERIEQGIGFLEGAIETVTGLLKGGTGDGGGIEKISSNIGTIAEKVGGLPWGAIGDAAQLLGTGSKALLDAFLGLPSWVQTAVLTGWGLNKLTGGALTGIAGELAKGLIKGVLGINAGVVNVNGKLVNGPGNLPTSGGGLIGTLTGLLGTAGALATIGGGLSAIDAIQNGTPDEKNQALIDLMQGFPGLIGREVAAALGISPGKPQPVTDKPAIETLDSLDDKIDDVNGRLEEANTLHVTNRQAVVAALTTEKSELQRQRAEIVRNRTAALSTGRETASRLRSGFTDNGAKIARMHADTSGHLSRVRAEEAAANQKLEVIKNKKSSVNVTVNTETNVALSAASTALYVQRITTSNNINAPQPGAVF